MVSEVKSWSDLITFSYLTNTSYTESVEDEDEVLTALSDELGGFVEYVGGPKYGHVLLSPLENLAAIEEPLVREKVTIPYFSVMHRNRNTRTRRLMIVFGIIRRSSR